ncbi:CoA protein activase [Candidatus Desantisbacteria bacterium]|nr:CoA protein activase [Candidatus Desantisbacteria bacterium]
MKHIIGIDAGSVSVKAAIINEKNDILFTDYIRHKGQPLLTIYEILKNINGKYDNPNIIFTGSMGKLIAKELGIEYINELAACSTSTMKFYPNVKTIIEMGGEDSKLLILENNAIKDFSLNSICAAGTGSFLDQQAERLQMSIEEFGETALRSLSPAKIAGRCSVFAKSDMIHLQQIATPAEAIVAGLCFAVAKNFKGSIVRGRQILSDISFQGGVALNKGMIRAFKNIFNIDNLIIPEYTAIMGAIGTALKASENKSAVPLNLKKIENMLSLHTYSDSFHPPLIKEGDEFKKRHIKKYESITLNDYLQSKKENTSISIVKNIPDKKLDAYMGIDIGSISTNLALIDDTGALISKRYIMTAGNPIKAVMNGLLDLGIELGDRINIRGVGTTGSARYMIADFVGADIVKNEITAQATAACFIDPLVDTIFEIGGQDSKYISLKNGIIINFEMNKACAAGTGSFLEEQAEKLNISIKNEFAEYAFSSKNPCKLGERCTVFMENSLVAKLQRGAQKNELLAGLAYSIVENYINRVVASREIGERSFFQGGTAFNKAVVAAFEKFLGKTITVPPNHDVTGAIGMGIIVRDHIKQKTIDKSLFKGFDLAKRTYEQNSFECKGCENICEINRIKIEGKDENTLYFGGRCEKYDIRKKINSLIPDLFEYRNKELWKSHIEWSEKTNKLNNASPNGKIGIPYIFFFHDYLPFWSTLLWELGFEVIVSPKTNKNIVNLGVEQVLADTCFPVKVAHGHVKYLLEKGVETLFIPSFINMNLDNDPFDKGYACPLAQSIPYQFQAAFNKVKIVSPIIKLKNGKTFLFKELKKAMQPFNINSNKLKNAIKKAQIAQDKFIKNIKNKGSEVISGLNKKAIVIIGRPYNSFDMGINLELPKKLASLEMISIPMDFLPDENIYETWPGIYWKSGQNIIKAAKTIKNNPLLYPIFIGNFSCGPDSFIHKIFEKELAGKPYLHIEIDEHSADAGAITRCEAYLDSIDAQIAKGITPDKKTFKLKNVQFLSRKFSKKHRTIYIPRMSDHAFALKAAFELYNVPAEVLPETDSYALTLGKKYATGKECYPYIVTTGDMLKKVFSEGFKPEESAFLMPSGSGPCRFGLYNVLHKIVLNDLGFKDIPIFAPNQDISLYKDLSHIDGNFMTKFYEGVLAIDLLTKCLHETRPYEKDKGLTDNLYNKYLEKIPVDLKKSNEDLMLLMAQMRKDFENIPRIKNIKKPLIGIVGEIFVRLNKFSNEELIRKIESLGGEVWLSTLDEWIEYLNVLNMKENMEKKDFPNIFNIYLKKQIQKRKKEKIEKHFNGFLKTIHEPKTSLLLKNASAYMHDSFEGEAILSVGKSIDFIKNNASAIINAMPFGCMPSTVATSIMRGISQEYGIPAISMPYDGTDASTTQLQLEAFMEQAKRSAK